MEATTFNENPILQEISAKKKSRQLLVQKRKEAADAWFNFDSDNELEKEWTEEPIDEGEIFGRHKRFVSVYNI